MVPILQRELKIIARRPRTFRIRLVVAIFAFLWCVALALSGPVAPGGSHVFNMLTVFAFLTCLVQSVRRAASCISDEKRDGTLGLLFLTDLRGRDIIAGKFLSVSALSTHALLAFLPVLAMTLILGGTLLAEVGRAALVLATTLVFSMSVGVFISTISAESKRASTATLFVLLASTIVPLFFLRLPFPFHMVSYFGLGPLVTGISDPGYRANAAGFWRNLAMVNLMSIAALALASRLVRTTWQDKPQAQTRQKKVLARPMTRQKANSLLDRNPAEWLCMRHAIGPLGRLVFIVAILAPVLALFGGWLNSNDNFAEAVVSAILVVSGLILLIRVASQSSFALAELRASGAVELVLSTPLHPSRLITGQAMALVRQFAPVLAAQAIGAAALTVMNPFGAVGTVLYGGAIYLTALLATGATGMWMGLREKSSNAAFTKTIAIVLLLPIPLCCVPQILFFPALFLIACAQITGKSLRRLLTKDSPGIVLMGSVPPVVPAPIKLSK